MPDVQPPPSWPSAADRMPWNLRRLPRLRAFFPRQMSNNTPAQAEMQKLTPEEFEKRIREQLADKLHADGTYHVTPKLMDEIIAERKKQMILEKEHRAMRDGLQEIASGNRSFTYTTVGGQKVSVRNPRWEPNGPQEIAAKVLSSLTVG